MLQVARFRHILATAAILLTCLQAYADAGIESSDAGKKQEPAGNPFLLPGTQPGELTQDLRGPKLCVNCHGEYAEHAANDTWSGSMMANAARDPLFHAALTIANQDHEQAGDICVRCHSPRAWLFGRSTPAELASLEDEDFESVQCDFCHRLVKSEPLLIGNGQYTVADDFVRRGPVSDAMASHETAYSAYHSQSELCGLCHDVSNPANGNFPIERTYTEWLQSAFATEERSCQSCHMPETQGPIAGARGLPSRSVHQHDFAGGNAWMPRVIAAQYPELGRADAFDYTARAAENMLQSSATLLIQSVQSEAARLSFEVRVTNLTGHKLPTGYPEGRQCWLEIVVSTSTGDVLLHSGVYDEAVGLRLEDEQLRTYEVKLAANGKEGFHFVLQDELLEDTRIPPRGFRPTPDTLPRGRDYPNIAEPGDAHETILAHWDDASYDTWVDPESGPVSISARLWYRTLSREYVEFLRNENHTDDSGERMFALWERHDRSPPVLMASTDLQVSRNELEALDAGAPSPDAGSVTGDTRDASPSPRRDTDASSRANPAKWAARDANTPASAGSDGNDASTLSDLAREQMRVDASTSPQSRGEDSHCACNLPGSAHANPNRWTWLFGLAFFRPIFNKKRRKINSC